MKHCLTYIIALLMVMGCKPTVPSEYIQPNDMENILYDYHLAIAMAKSDYASSPDVQQNAYFQAVLKKYDVTEAVFDSSLVYYYSHLDRLKDIYGNVNMRLADEAERIGAVVGDLHQYSQYGTSGDTANIWVGPVDVMLIPRTVNNRFDFTVNADSTFLLGDSFMFQFMTEYIWQSGAPSATVAICARYENDSITFHSANVATQKGICQLRVPSNTTSRLKDLRGFVYLGSEESGDIRRLMFISQMQLIRFHNKNIQETANERTDSVKTDSLKRSAHDARAVADTASRNLGSGLRSKSGPFRKGGGKN